MVVKARQDVLRAQKVLVGVRRVEQSPMNPYDDVRQDASVGNIGLAALLRKLGFDLR